MSFVAAFKNSAGDYIEVFRNPTRKELHEIESWKQYGSVRGLITESGDFMCWDAKALHPEVQEKLHMKECISILVGDNYIYVTENVRDRFKEAGELITRHKDDLALLIGEFEISHFEADTKGNVITQPFEVVNPKYHWITLIGQDREKILRLAKYNETKQSITEPS